MLDIIHHRDEVDRHGETSGELEYHLRVSYSQPITTAWPPRVYI